MKVSKSEPALVHPIQISQPNNPQDEKQETKPQIELIIEITDESKKLKRPRSLTMELINSRVIAMEGWLELRYGETSNPELLLKIDENPNFKKKYWFYAVGGFLNWYLEENQKLGKDPVGRIDLKNDVLQIKDIIKTSDGDYCLSITAHEFVKRKGLEEFQEGDIKWVKTSVKPMEEQTEYIFCSPELEIIEKWKNALSKSMMRRSASSLNSKSANSSRVFTPHKTLHSSSSSSLVHVNPEVLLNSHSDLQSSNNSSPSSSPSSPYEKKHFSNENIKNNSLVQPANTSNESARMSPTLEEIDQGPSSNRARIIKIQGYLELEIKIQGENKTDTLEKQTYWFQLIGGYLRWYSNEQSSTSAIQPSVGILALTLGSAEVGEIETEKNEKNEKTFHFYVGTVEGIQRKEGYVTDEQSSSIFKTTVKREKRMYLLSSKSEETLVHWRNEIESMVKRRIKK